MKFHLLQHYYKAGILIPFYTALAFSALVLVRTFGGTGMSLSEVTQHSLTHHFLFLPLYSGLTGLVSLSAFLNYFKPVACCLSYSATCWFLPAVCFMAGWLFYYIDWQLVTAPVNYLVHVPLFVITGVHLIGLVISYIDFRASVVLFLKEEKMTAAQRVQVLAEVE